MKPLQFVFDERSLMDRETLIRRGFQEVVIGDFHLWIPKAAKICNCLQNRVGTGHWRSCPSYEDMTTAAEHQE